MTSKKKVDIDLKNKNLSEFDNECIKKFNSIPIDKKLLEKDHISIVYKFKSRGSSDIKITTIKEAEKNINRQSAKNNLAKYIIYPIADEIEKGLFEFSLIHITVNKLHDHFINTIYLDKLHDICSNIDIKNDKIKNDTLLPMMFNETFSPYFTAFLSPEQMHPKRWIDVVKKQQIRDEAINSFHTTDMYKCAKCGERKFKISEIQLRCADESSNKIIQCLVCFHTFIK